jgi:hypothetical protein
VVQIATKFGHAPVAYSLSAFAGVVYILATVTLAVGTPAARRIAVLSCSVRAARPSGFRPALAAPLGHAGQNDDPEPGAGP